MRKVSTCVLVLLYNEMNDTTLGLLLVSQSCYQTHFYQTGSYPSSMGLLAPSPLGEEVASLTPSPPSSPSYQEHERSSFWQEHGDGEPSVQIGLHMPSTTMNTIIHSYCNTVCKPQNYNTGYTCHMYNTPILLMATVSHIVVLTWHGMLLGCNIITFSLMQTILALKIMLHVQGIILNSTMTIIVVWMYIPSLLSPVLCDPVPLV